MRLFIAYNYLKMKPTENDLKPICGFWSELSLETSNTNETILKFSVYSLKSR